MQGEAGCADWGLQTGGQSGVEEFFFLQFRCLAVTAAVDTSHHWPWFPRRKVGPKSTVQ